MVTMVFLCMRAPVQIVPSVPLVSCLCLTGILAKFEANLCHDPGLSLVRFLS